MSYLLSYGRPPLSPVPSVPSPFPSGNPSDPWASDLLLRVENIYSPSLMFSIIHLLMVLFPSALARGFMGLGMLGKKW